MANCASCKGKPCRRGVSEGRPADCPGKEVSQEEVLSLYSEEDRRAAKVSAKVEAEGYAVATRVEEIMDYAYKMGYHKIGLAFCAGLSEEAAIFTEILASNGFAVESVCCKNCSVSKSYIGIEREEYAHPENEFEPMCNPVGQAKVLDDAGCDLAVLLGLCVGHDTLFIKHLKAPCTVLGVKDRAMGNNPLGAIYTARGYMKRQYHFLRDKYGEA